MAAKNELLPELLAEYPDGVEALVRFGLAELLKVEPDSDLGPYLKRTSILKHRNDLLELRLDYLSERERGQMLMVLGPEQRGDRLSDYEDFRPAYFGQEAEGEARLNEQRLAVAAAFPPPKQSSTYRKRKVR